MDMGNIIAALAGVIIVLVINYAIIKSAIKKAIKEALNERYLAGSNIPEISEG
jgi:F0F1-type ATP synthase membrane subunit b/b'